MEKKSFLKSKEGGLAAAFIVIMIGFFVSLMGLKAANDALCLAGFVLMVLAMLYSPVRVYFMKPDKKNR